MPPLYYELLEGATLPQRQHADDAAYDLHAYALDPFDPADPMEAADGEMTFTIPELGGHALIPTGLRIALPTNVAGLILPRSGLAYKHRITVLNAPGLIDPGYRGEVNVILVNLGNDPFTIHHGDRIAQLLPISISPNLTWIAGVLPDSTRGPGGFGSTG